MFQHVYQKSQAIFQFLSFMFGDILPLYFISKNFSISSCESHTLLRTLPKLRNRNLEWYGTSTSQQEYELSVIETTC